MAPRSGASEGKPETEPGVLQLFTWEEVGLRTGKGDFKEERWLVIDRKVYDVSQFYLRHPGGPRLIRHYSGQDATNAFAAFHKDEDLVKKYLNSLLIGELAPDQPCCEPTQNEMLVKDFHELRATVKKMGLLKPRLGFFAFMFLHAFMLDIASWFTIWYFGKSWMSFLLGVAMFVVAQIQYGFLQHDLGHMSVFENPKFNMVAHLVVMGFLKGIPVSMWKHLHDQHHAKPNCYRKDPDVNMHPFLFSLGKKLSLQLGKKKKKYMPYQYQHNYFVLFAPLMYVIYLQLVSYRYVFQRRKWLELIYTVFYNIRVCLMYVPLMGFKSFMAYFWLARCLEAGWFIWVTQMNHIPMNIDYDQNLDWFSAQGFLPDIMGLEIGLDAFSFKLWFNKLTATCNVDESLFNNWYTGHLNFQIEHHLFPTMPRHNYYKVAPLVKSLCVKHNVKYECKPMLTAFADIVRTLKESGKVWYNAYYKE